MGIQSQDVTGSSRVQYHDFAGGDTLWRISIGGTNLNPTFRLFFRIATFVALLAVLPGCSTVNRIVNMPFRAAESALTGTERFMSDPNVLPRTLDRGMRSPYVSPRTPGFQPVIFNHREAPISYNDFAKELIRPEPNLMIPILP